MASEVPDAARVVARALSQVPRGERPELARQIVAHAAASLCLSEGEKTAAEALYRIADAVVSRGAAKASL